MPIKKLTASGQVAARPITVYAVNGLGGVDAWTVALANKATGSGTAVVEWGGAATTYTDGPKLGPKGEIFGTACYATITGTTPSVWIHYENTPGNNVS